MSAESGGAEAKIAGSQGCWPRVLLSSRYLSLFFVALAPLTKTHKHNKQDNEKHYHCLLVKPACLSACDASGSSSEH